jgi:phage-related protein
MGPVGWAIALFAVIVAAVIVFWDEIVAAFRAAAQWVGSIMQGIWDWIKQVWDGIVNAFRTAGQWVIDAVQNTWNWVKNIWDTVINFFRQIPGWITGIFSGALNWLLNAGKNILTGLWNGIKDIWNGVVQWFRELPGRIWDFVKDAGTWLVDAGRNLVQGLINGILNRQNSFWRTVQDLVSPVPRMVDQGLQNGSPSKLAIQSGEWFTEGLMLGIQNRAAEVYKTVSDLTEGVASTMSGVNPSVGMSIGGSDAFWDGTALGVGSVPPSREVASHAASQGVSPTAGKVVNINTNIYNPVVEDASDSEARRLRALSALGAF